MWLLKKHLCYSLLLFVFPILFFSCNSTENSKRKSDNQSWNNYEENHWGIYTWFGDLKDINKEEYPLVKGVPLVLGWSDIEPEEGKFTFEKTIGEKLKLLKERDMYTFLMIWVASPGGPHTPDWLYENGVPEVKMTPSMNPLGEMRSNVTFPYYLDKDYIKFYYRMIDAFGTYVKELPKELQDRILFVQSAEGTTGDGGFYKGEPLDKRYEIDWSTWGDFRIRAWEQYKKAFTNDKGDLVKPFLVNYDSNEEKQYNWLLDNFTEIGLKNGMFSHGYQISNTQGRLKNWKNFKEEVKRRDKEFFSRGEQDAEWAVYGWSTQNPKQALYWSAIYATYGGLDMWNVPDEATKGVTYKDAFKFFNKYAGYHDPSTAPSAFCALRKGLDASNTKAYPEEVYGKAVKKNVDRYIAIAKAFSDRGAMQGDPSKAMGGGMINRKRQDYNDVGWKIALGNYYRFIEQIEPDKTSVGWWHVGSQENIYGRFARGFDDSSGKDAMYFNINDTFFRNNPLNGSYAIKVQVIYLDKGNSSWSLKYDAINNPSKTAITVTNTNSGKWEKVSVVLDDANFGNRGPMKSDLSLIYVDGRADNIFHMIELDRKF